MDDKNLYLEHREEGSGLRTPMGFIPFLKDGERPDVIVSIPWDQGQVERNLREYPNLVVTKGKCDQCGCEVQLAGSSRELLSRFPGLPTRCLNCAVKEVRKLNGNGDRV